jgi:predicted phage tail protein
MKAFTPNHKHGKIIALYYETKAEAMKKLNVTRPTIDKICKDGELFYKYIPKIAKSCGVSSEEIVRNLSKIK